LKSNQKELGITSKSLSDGIVDPLYNYANTQTNAIKPIVFAVLDHQIDKELGYEAIHNSL